MFKKMWNSPTITTWMSYSTQALTLFGVLPLVLKKFSNGDIVLWYLFASIITMQNLADFGFRQTFSRIISYAFSGASDIGIFKEVTEYVQPSENGPNLLLLNSITSTMHYIYKRLTIILFFLLLVFGSFVMNKPAASASNIYHAWVAWGVVLLVTCISFYGKIYLTFLEGLFKIATVRRIETLTSLGSICTSIIVLTFWPSLLNLILANQFWILIVVVRDWYLCRTVENTIYLTVSKPLPFDRKIFDKIWKPAWRSGISGFMSIGLTNITGIIYAQMGKTAEVASYLLAFRLIDQIRTLSMAPLYSKIPLFARLRVQQKMQELIKVISRGMFLSHFTFILGFIVIGLFSDVLMKIIHSNVSFVSQSMWILLGCAFFIQRYGAMHIQVYMSTNHIIAHIADGVSGILYIVSALVLSRYINIYAVPIAMIIGYLGFYSWYAAIYSYKSLKVRFWDLEKRTSLIPACLFVIYILFQLNK